MPPPSFSCHEHDIEPTSFPSVPLPSIDFSIDFFFVLYLLFAATTLYAMITCYKAYYSENKPIFFISRDAFIVNSSTLIFADLLSGINNASNSFMPIGSLFVSLFFFPLFLCFLFLISVMCKIVVFYKTYLLREKTTYMLPLYMLMPVLIANIFHDLAWIVLLF